MSRRAVLCCAVLQLAMKPLHYVALRGAVDLQGRSVYEERVAVELATHLIRAGARGACGDLVSHGPHHLPVTSLVICPGVFSNSL